MVRQNEWGREFETSMKLIVDNCEIKTRTKTNVQLKEIYDNQNTHLK